MKTFILSLLVLALTSSFAQQSITRKGGTPGHETSWNEPRNWSNYQVPDEFSHVVIQVLNTGHFAQPVIDQEVEVASIEIQAGASLTVTVTGSVLIDGENQYTEGIVNLGGNLLNDGLITMLNMEDFSAERPQFSMKGSGLVVLDNTDVTSEVLFAGKP